MVFRSRETERFDLLEFRPMRDVDRLLHLRLRPRPIIVELKF